MGGAAVAITSGYYRYSDILFEWHQVIEDPAERSALKGFLKETSLTDPNNPLRKEGVDGIELYMGTLMTGQSRLMFSCEQIEYIRYWLHKMQLTKGLLPLPSSDYLLTADNLRNWSPVVYRNASEMKKALRNVDKNNKKLKGTDSELMSFRQTFDRVRTYYGEKAGTWLAIDFEAWEMEHTLITELGWSYVRWKDGKEETAEGHYIVKDNMSYRNGKYVPDAREKYNFGESVILSKEELKRKIHAMFTDYVAAGPLFLVFHDESQDVRYLRSTMIGAPMDGFTYLLPDSCPEEGIYIVDTITMFAALQGDAAERQGLGTACHLLGIETTNLHNAGNDAHYTLQALRAMASGNQLDLQREERWPNRPVDPANTGAPSTLKVNFPRWDLEDDVSDTEGMIGRPLKKTEVIAQHPDEFNDSEGEDDFL